MKNANYANIQVNKLFLKIFEVCTCVGGRVVATPLHTVHDCAKLDVCVTKCLRAHLAEFVITSCEKNAENKGHKVSSRHIAGMRSKP